MKQGEMLRRGDLKDKLKFKGVFVLGILALVFLFPGEASALSSYWKNYFSIEERKAVQKNAEKYTISEIESKSKKWKGIIRGYNIKNGSISDRDIKENGIATNKIRGLGDYINEKISDSSTSQDFSAGNLTGTYAALDGSQIVNLNPSNISVGTLPVLNGSQITDINPTNITGSGNLNIGNGDLFVDDTSGNVGIGTTSPAAKLDVNGDISIRNANLVLNQVGRPSAPSVAINSTSGNLNGNYQYIVTFVTSSGETEAGANSATISPSNQQINLTNIPISTDSSVIARKIYRNIAADYTVPTILMKLVATINDNITTIYTDNIADVSLGVAVPRVNTTGGVIYNGSNRMGVADEQSTSFGLNSMANNTGYANTAFGRYTLDANTTGMRNSAFGLYGLHSNTTGYENSTFGVHSLNYNTTGNSLSAFGFSTLMNNTTGYSNSAFGNSALVLNTDGYENSAFGRSALNTTLSSYRNSAFGSNTLYALTTGTENSAFGASALRSNTTGNLNIALGAHAGRFITDGSTGNTTGGISVFLGGYTKALANGQTNQIVIGYNATGLGSNTVVLGNDSILTTALKGDVGIGTTTPAVALDVNGQVKIQKSSAQPFDCDATHDGTIALTSGYRTCVCKGETTTWVFTTDGTTSCTW